MNETNPSTCQNQEEETTNHSSQPVVPNNNLVSLWGLSPSSTQEVGRQVVRYKMSHGMFAGVPLLCKAQDCPYKDVCTISQANRIVGQRCPMEAGAIVARFEEYCRYFDIDITDPTPLQSDVVDLALIKDLVEIEIQILRAENRIAINGDFIVKTIGTVDSRGRAYYEDDISTESDFKIRLLDKKWKALQLLDSTRKDKAKKMTAANNPSKKAATLFSKINELMTANDDDTVVTISADKVQEAEYKTVDEEVR